MSQIKIRAALENALGAVAPLLPTAWENQAFVLPADGSPYQKAFVLFAEPENPAFDSSHRERGIFQVTLMYRKQVGTAESAARAELLRGIFKRGTTLVKDGVSVIIERTPEVASGMPDGDRWATPIKIRFYSTILS